MRTPVFAVFIAGFACTAAGAQPRAIDAAKSVLTVRVFKAGLLSALGHNHEIAAPIAAGKVDTNTRTVELHVQAAALQVRDPEASEKDRGEIQHTMQGPEVLDVATHPEISFKSTAAEPAGAGAWKVQGNLTVHGETHPVTVEVHEENGHFAGSSQFKLTEFGIKPVKIAGGTVRVKDEVRIEFNVQLRAE